MLMREYETLYILRPDLAEDAVAKLNERLTGVLDREGAKILRLDIWGKKKLAYEVKKNPKGLYVHLSYLGQPQVVSEFERNLRMLEPVIKYQTIRIADDVDMDRRVAEQEAEDRARAAVLAQRQAELQALAAAQPAAAVAAVKEEEAPVHEAGAEEPKPKGATDDNDEWEE
jgi:ribosomal protein S6